VTDECDNGSQVDWAWFTDEAENYSGPSLFAVAPGDVISAKVYLDVNGDWDYVVTDVTSGATSGHAETNFAPLEGSAGEAEWIEEDPGCSSSNPLCLDNHGLNVWPFPNFGSVTFTNLSLYLSGSGGFTLPYSDATEMISSNGSVEALPSPIQGSGASATFTVTYETPGEMSSTAGTAAMKHGQSTFVAPMPRSAPQHRARQLGGRSIPAPKLGLARIR
jgi:hypothetical protein